MSVEAHHGRRLVALTVGVLLGVLLGGAAHVQAQTEASELTVAVVEAEPFVVREGDVPGGFLAEVWDHVATGLGWSYDVVWVDSLGEMADLITAGTADVGIAPVSSTRDLEGAFDFTSPVVASGPVLGVHQRTETPVSVAGALVSVDILRLLGWSAVALLILGHLMWWAERNQSETDFSQSYVRGIWDGMWWAMVTVTTVGYGDKSPRTNGGRAVAMLAMIGSLFLLGAFVSEVTTALQAQRAAAVVGLASGPQDQPVGVIEGSSYQDFLDERGVTTVGYSTQPDVFAAAAAGDVDIVVADRYSMDAQGADYGLRGTGDLLYDEFISFAVREDSPLTSDINGVLSDLHQRGVVRDIIERWID